MNSYSKASKIPGEVGLPALIAPAALSVALVAWTIVVSPFSAYGDYWAIVPALAILPAVLVWHFVLVIRYRLNAVLPAVVHLAVLVPVWLWCLMRISKDSL